MPPHSLPPPNPSLPSRIEPDSMPKMLAMCLDTGAAHLTLLEQQLSVVLRLLRIAQQQKGERRSPAKRV